MSDTVPVTISKPQKPSKGFWWALVILFVVMPTVIMLGASFRTSNSTAAKTEVIIQTLRNGMMIAFVEHGRGPTFEFPALLKLCGESTALQELQSLRAIDHERQCFIDGWGRPLMFARDEHGGISIISSGEDGISGTNDDIH